MNSIVLEISLVLVLLLANGVFAMTEIAIVSSRKRLLQSMADSDSSSAAKALRLSEDSNNIFLRSDRDHSCGNHYRGVAGRLSWSTGSLMKLFGIRVSEESSMSREELTVLVREGMVIVSISGAESQLMQGVIGF